MTLVSSPRRLAQREFLCALKRRYDNWEDARLAGLAVWKEAPREQDANPPAPYPCDLGGERHYHVGHIRTP